MTNVSNFQLVAVAAWVKLTWKDFIIYAFCELNIEIFLKMSSLQIRFKIQFIAGKNAVKIILIIFKSSQQWHYKLRIHLISIFQKYNKVQNSSNYRDLSQTFDNIRRRYFWFISGFAVKNLENKSIVIIVQLWICEYCE